MSSTLQRVLDNLIATFKKQKEYVDNMLANPEKINPPQRYDARDQKTHEVRTIATSSPSTSNYIPLSLYMMVYVLLNTLLGKETWIIYLDNVVSAKGESF